MMIILTNRLNHNIFTEVGDAKLLAVHVHLHVEAIGRGLDSITGKKLAKVLTVHFWSTLGLAEGEAVIVHGEESGCRGQFIYFELDAVAQEQKGKERQHRRLEQ